MDSRAGKFAADPGSLVTLQQALRARRTDPVALTEAALARIDAAEGHVQGFRIVDRDGALAQAERLHDEARAAQWRGPLHGIPVAIKDVIDVAGLPTRAGSRSRAQAAPATIDAQAVARLRSAGAIIVGKAHTTEFAYFDGPPPTRNPHDLSRTPGGSSSGPAAVVAAGMVPLTLGTQTAGSVSRPAAYCGIAAFKPSTQAWSAFGVVPFAPSFDTVGVFGYRTADAIAAARVLAPPYLAATWAAPERITIVRLEDPSLDAASVAVLRSVNTAAEKIAAEGATVLSRTSPVAFADLIAAHKVISEYELGRAHAPLLTMRSEVTPSLIEAVERGAAIRDTAYLAARNVVDKAARGLWALFSDSDAILFPAAPDIAPVGMKTGDPRFIIPFTALGGPIVSVPVGFDQGLPLGVMLAGAPGADARLALVAERIAAVIEVPR